MGQAASHALVAAADLQPPLAMGVSGLEAELGEGLQHVKMLGSTRFMKTIQCKHQSEGQLVLHVFMRPVSMTFDLSQQIATLRKLYEKLSNSRHILAHARVISDERAVYILRQYLHNNLYDRISTRPFLSATEKRWIAYQILVALRESHSQGVCHGDIKCENVAVTSWDLVYLTDLAPFKPTHLPADNPAEFNFYFDTSSRQCCCIAPERFYDPGSSVAQTLASTNSVNGDSAGLLALKPSMDIFSAGCVVAELFLDGNPLFSLSRLLQYRKGNIDPASLVSGIADREIAELVLHMIQLDPDVRLSAAEYLDRWQPIFPRAPLAAYMYQADADTRMQALYSEIDDITDNTCEIMANVTCATVRNCALPSSRCLGIKVLLRCSQGPMKGDPDLILPYLVALALDPSPQVRAQATTALRDLLVDLDKLTPINSNLFDDYLAPQLLFFSGDQSVQVRCILASVIADIADASFYLTGSNGASSTGGLSQRTDFLGTQLRAIVSKLSFDEAEVKHVLLCSFPQLYERGIQSLSHIITYLNDRDCWFLRAAFFDVVFAASGQISRHASREYIVPLINLADQEVFVVVSALRALVRLVPQMSPAMIWDKLVEVQASCDTLPLRAGAREFTEFAIKNAKLPMPESVTRHALDIVKATAKRKQADSYQPHKNGLDDSSAKNAPERLTHLGGVGAALRTIFLSPVSNPWKALAKHRTSSSKGERIADHGADFANALSDDDGHDRDNDASDTPSNKPIDDFIRKKSVELDFPAVPRRQRFENWRPIGTLVAEIAEHNDAVSCLAASNGAMFVSGSDDGTVRLFDGGAFRKNAVCRSSATFFQGGRIKDVAFHPVLSCFVSCSDNGSIHVHRVRSRSFVTLASTTLPKGEYAASLGFVKGAAGASLVAATSKSRILFLSMADLKLEDAIDLQPAYGRLTALATDGSTVAVAGTSNGLLVLIDMRFRIELKTFSHFLSHQITCLSMYKAESVLVGTVAGDVCVLSLRTGKWPVCVCSRSLQELKSNEINRKLCVNGIRNAPQMTYFISGSNDAMLRYWDLERLERSYVINASEAAPPYSSYRLNDTVYYCENTPSLLPHSSSIASHQAKANDSSAAGSRSAGPVTSVALLGSPAAMLVSGLQSGAIRVLI